ncbi:TadE family protein [Pseudovibrio sp. Tun.PSC04-5.I4]|uniref:TadE/TadG family type IV pilus assembly protein n=1 Tax=Pseudovibrio sp. Tun.PSC04-5.I4 TaxID=1798213 RepID=UPI001AD8D4E8|nr:TadE family protein [Pseudovibrio sp. Tun.PSC04-5.I4]
MTAIEFAGISIVLFPLVMAIFELGLSFLVEVLLDNAVSEAARQIRTGQVFNGQQNGTYNKTKFKNVILENGTGLLKSVEDKIFIDVISVPDFGDIPEARPLIEDGNVVMTQNWDPGGASDVVLVRVVCAWPMITSKMIEIFGASTNGNRILVATEVFRNEPF